MSTPPQLPIHFFTIVLDGEPYIRYHINTLKKLTIPWHWHIVEGLAELAYDTAWSTHTGGRAPHEIYPDGRSKDGTSEYIDLISRANPKNISVYRKPVGRFWDGKIEMVRAPLVNILESCLMWQIDSDELWTAEQISTMHRAFQNQPNRSAAFFWCHYFVGPDKVITTRDCYGNNSAYEWLRVWRFSPGMQWIAHEPPTLATRSSDGNYYNVASRTPFNHAETEELGLVFQHMSYTTESQLQFKEKYYGYHGATAAWKALQQNHQNRILLRKYFNWVKDCSIVENASRNGIKKLFF